MPPPVLNGSLGVEVVVVSVGVEPGLNGSPCGPVVEVVSGLLYGSVVGGMGAVVVVEGVVVVVGVTVVVVVG